MNRLITGIAVLAAIVLSILFAIQPWSADDGIKLGLDLQGGLRVSLEADIPNPDPEDLQTARNIVENRVNQFGVSEPLVQTAGQNRIAIELPGLTAEDQNRALDLIGQQAILHFRIVKTSAQNLATDQLTLDDLEEPAFTGEIIESASATFSTAPGAPAGPIVTFTTRSEYHQAFGNFTASNIGRRMAIVLDDEIITSPTLQARISSDGQITGMASLDEAGDVALVLRSGSLPISLHVAEIRSIGPTLGQDAIRAGSISAIVGGVAVVLLVVILYGPLFGGVLSFGVLLALLFVFGVLGGLGAALTLPGIAGLVLTIGASIDGNVISFERIREELRHGRGLRLAMKNGFRDSLSAIIDANFTTLIAAGALYQYTTGPVRGFAVTLAIGVIASVLVNTVIAPFILDVLTIKNQRSFMRLGKPYTGIPFLEMSRRIVPVALVIGVLFVGVIGFKGVNYSADFTGGTTILLDVPEGTSIADVRQAVDDVDIPGITGQGAVVVEVDDPTLTGNFINVRTPLVSDSEVGSDELPNRLAENLNATVVQTEFVGPAVGADLRKGAISAILVSLALILAYIGFRFWPSWVIAIAAVLTTAYNVIFTVGVQSLLGIEFSIPLIAALLFVLGYSLNDIVIVSDRIRENVASSRNATFFASVNEAINQTLSRTVVTSVSTLLPAVALLIFGGSVLRGFSITIILGIVIATLSSIFIHSPFVIFLERIRRDRASKKPKKRPAASN